ncbi:MAG: FAD-linked oxidase C-terminal domain-containing protein [Actinomycetota bacterium]
MADLLAELHARLDPQRIQTDADVIGAYSQDRAIFESGGIAAVLVSPDSTEEVVAVVEAAKAANAIIVPRGAGTGLTGAANAVDGCIMLSLHRMNQVLEIDPVNRMARVQPGVINSDLKAAVAEHGLYYPPDPASYEMSSIGGNVATNAGGLCCVKYGVTRDYVMGLEVVLANGDVITTGRDTIKSTAGLDLTGVFVGSEGVLGIITEITVKLEPAPAAPETAVAYFDELPACGEAIEAIFARGLRPTVMEIVDQASLRMVERVFPMDLDTDAACLILMQSSPADQPIEELAEVCVEHGASFVYHAEDPAEGEMLLEVRRRVWPAAERLEKALLPEDVAVKRQHLPELLQGIVDIAAQHDVTIPTIGHAGDGNMHPILIFDANDADEVARVRAAFAEIIELSLSLGGTMAGEHGVGTLKREFLEEEVDPVALEWQRRTKAMFDPEGRLNPGKAL